jgi:hypothetical protein
MVRVLDCSGTTGFEPAAALGSQPCWHRWPERRLPWRGRQQGCLGKAAAGCRSPCRDRGASPAGTGGRNDGFPGENGSRAAWGKRQQAAAVHAGIGARFGKGGSQFSEVGGQTANGGCPRHFAPATSKLEAAVHGFHPSEPGRWLARGITTYSRPKVSMEPRGCGQNDVSCASRHHNWWFLPRGSDGVLEWCFPSTPLLHHFTARFHQAG